MKPLPDLARDGILTKSFWGQVKSIINANFREVTLQPGVGYTLKNSPGGASLVVKKQHGGGPGAAPQPLQLEITTDPDDTSHPPEQKIRVYASTVAGGSSTDIGFSEGDSPGYFLELEAGVVQAGITINDTTGEVTSRWIERVESLTADEPTTGTYYVEIGTVGDEDDTWTVSNSRYGPIGASVCRNWFAASAPFYGVTWV